MKDLKELLEHQVKDLYSAESQLEDILPKLTDVACNERLKQSFAQNLQTSFRHKQRLEQIAELMHFEAQGENCVGMKGLIKEEQKVCRSHSEPEVLDAALIGAAQKVEHYQIAGYGTARAYAQMIGESEVAELLSRCLSDVKNEDHKLTNIAMGGVNHDAANGHSVD
jgi:ferritin-like metal-binding protein YciE